MLRAELLLCVMITFSVPALAQETHSRNPGAGTANDTTYYPVYRDNNFSVGGYSSTTTQGGYNEGGSGQAIPDNTRDSSQDTSRGIGLQYEFK